MVAEEKHIVHKTSLTGEKERLERERERERRKERERVSKKERESIHSDEQ